MKNKMPTYYELHKEERKAYSKKYRLEHPDYLKNYDKNHRKENCEKQKRYREKHLNKCKKRCIIYKQNNKTTIKKNMIDYENRYPDRVKKRKRDWNRNKSMIKICEICGSNKESNNHHPEGYDDDSMCIILCGPPTRTDSCHYKADLLKKQGKNWIETKNIIMQSTANEGGGVNG
jgi:hypothetical protein